MSVATYIAEAMTRSSWIRKMFEEGARLKAQFGEENVYDFSLGNPDVTPPKSFFSTLQSLASQPDPKAHGYMPNAGFMSARTTIAKKVAKDHSIDISGDYVILTCGAAGGLNVALKTILNPGEEVIVPKPYFVEYGFYIANHNGIINLVPTKSDFALDIDAIEKAINEKTRAVLINSPNNPTGVIYSHEDITRLAALLQRYSEKFGKPIYLLSDEPYRELVYDNSTVPSILSHYTHSMVVSSFSKTLSLPGERIGYIAINPSMPEADIVMAGLILCNRILGFVNAPALMQRVVEKIAFDTVDVKAYSTRRDMICEGLQKAGYSFVKPKGAFYVFCKSPLEDDVVFVKHLLNFNILAVPGVGFGGPGFFRLAFCVPEKVIEKSMPQFKKALESLS
ncbi:MAG TPA: pyridoxal phosphate-dependent aminotransferase [Spirochaetota bacterium]|nr:pyridoxal phosphate-dependent aminotransferase [Spirochaetota bacterium]